MSVLENVFFGDITSCSNVCAFIDCFLLWNFRTFVIQSNYCFGRKIPVYNHQVSRSLFHGTQAHFVIYRFIHYYFEIFVGFRTFNLHCKFFMRHWG